jgi:hypothetical protein
LAINISAKAVIQIDHSIDAINGVANQLPILRYPCYLVYCGFVIRPTWLAVAFRLRTWKPSSMHGLEPKLVANVSAITFLGYSFNQQCYKCYSMPFCVMYVIFNKKQPSAYANKSLFFQAKKMFCCSLNLQILKCIDLQISCLWPWANYSCNLKDYLRPWVICFCNQKD